MYHSLKMFAFWLLIFDMVLNKKSHWCSSIQLAIHDFIIEKLLQKSNIFVEKLLYCLKSKIQVSLSTFRWGLICSNKCKFFRKPLIFPFTESTFDIFCQGFYMILFSESVQCAILCTAAFNCKIISDGNLPDWESPFVAGTADQLSKAWWKSVLCSAEFDQKCRYISVKSTLWRKQNNFQHQNYSWW